MIKKRITYEQDSNGIIVIKEIYKDSPIVHIINKINKKI